MPRRPSFPIPPSTLLTILVVAVGCGPARPKRIEPPPLDPDAVVAALMARADADGDGVVKRGEFGRVGALAKAAQDFDEDHDGAISAAELRQWLEQVRASRIAITSFAGEVRHLKRPLANATVKLVPEDFMGPGMQAAAGVTDESGRFSATIPDAKYPGVNCGFYRVEITGQGNDGKPLPETFNTRSTLGVAVGGRLPENGVAVFVLE